MISILLASVDHCPPSAYFFGCLGAACAMVFASLGAAYGTAKAGVGMASAAILRPENIFKNSLPIIFAGALGVYGVVIVIVINQAMPAPGTGKYPSFLGFHHLAGGLASGFANFAAGIAIGIVGDAGVRAAAQQPKMFIGMAVTLIFAEAIALLGVISAVVLNVHVPAGFECLMEY